MKRITCDLNPKTRSHVSTKTLHEIEEGEKIPLPIQKIEVLGGWFEQTGANPKDTLAPHNHFPQWAIPNIITSNANEEKAQVCQTTTHIVFRHNNVTHSKTQKRRKPSNNGNTSSTARTQLCQAKGGPPARSKKQRNMQPAPFHVNGRHA